MAQHDLISLQSFPVGTLLLDAKTGTTIRVTGSYTYADTSKLIYSAETGKAIGYEQVTRVDARRSTVEGGSGTVTDKDLAELDLEVVWTPSA